MDHTHNLSTLQWNLECARERAHNNPTEFNWICVADLTQAMADYRRYITGEIELHQMCWTAIELAMDMPKQGTYET